MRWARAESRSRCGARAARCCWRGPRSEATRRSRCWGCRPRASASASWIGASTARCAECSAPR
ncbi:hypothetical protein XM48_12815 [Leucobacter sp. Ag1]|nr:hypothetical protein XM48_12815 [Leucobacter sp. Ag1]